jgi:hypothetical protein
MRNVTIRLNFCSTIALSHMLANNGFGPRSGRENAIEKFSMAIVELTSSNFVVYRIYKTSARSD